MQLFGKELISELGVGVGRNAGNQSRHLAVWPNGGVFGVIKTQFHADRAVVIDEPADAELYAPQTDRPEDSDDENSSGPWTS